MSNKVVTTVRAAKRRVDGGIAEATAAWLVGVMFVWLMEVIAGWRVGVIAVLVT